MEKIPRQPKESIFSNDFYKIMAWFKSDITIILVCLIAVLACVFTLMTVGKYQQQINDKWIMQWTEICDHPVIGREPVVVNQTFNLWGKYENANQNIDQDT